MCLEEAELGEAEEDKLVKLRMFKNEALRNGISWILLRNVHFSYFQGKTVGSF